jgi:hypothetical protein
MFNALTNRRVRAAASLKQHPGTATPATYQEMIIRGLLPRPH